MSTITLRQVLVAGLAAAAAVPFLAGCGAPAGSEQVVSEQVVSLIAPAGAVFHDPLDAVPAADGSAVWFTATGAAGPGVFVVRDGTPTPLATGAPFRAPTGLALTADDRGLLVADPDADAVFALPIAGGAPAEVAGTRGLHPRGVEVAGDQLYVTGTDPGTRTGAVFRLPVTGGTPTLVGGGLAAPDGVTVAPDGAVLVTDRPGSVVRLHGGTATTLVRDALLGSPAGITLTADGTTLLVSSLAPAGTAQVLLLDPVTGASRGLFDEVIGANHASGGLHLAHAGGLAAWVSRERGVHRVDTTNLRF